MFNEMIGLIENKINIVAQKRIDVGGVRLLVRTDNPEFKGYEFFYNWENHFNELGNDYEVTFIEGAIDEELYTLIHKLKDSSYRSRRFESGYYITDHFGPGIICVKFENKFYYFGQALYNVFWPYFVKYILTIRSIETDSIHLKGAVFEYNGKGGLLVGRGGGGKTVLLNHICNNGGLFVANTHNLVKNGTLYGVKSNIRVRKDSFFGDLIEKISPNSAIKKGDYNISPEMLYPVSRRSVELRAIFVVNSRKDGKGFIQPMCEEEMAFYLNQFSLALNVYGLKEDILDYCNGDVISFSKVCYKMQEEIYDLVRRCKCYHLNLDLLVQENRVKFNDLLNDVFK